ncbi:microcin-processing peptidase 1 [Mizugakiibacter sediminis]|uniref:Microcin-processing peptidase 1 n=1 Tax=Mizugakiibacter sediminis TaxID=1475481 RepID=A0A0K8QNP5_9GAMM|nr:metalloprotease PmbA [Mizugakiibacter sediminis]GAP66520.1 microcin-processing peptidase 1 [Mizugakiibacter sediminis]
MNTRPIAPDRSLDELDRLAELAEDVIRRCRAAGASQAEVAASIDTGLNVSVRLGEVETVERTRDRGFGITVYFGRRKGSASTADLQPDSIEASIRQACAIARYTEEDPAAGLADAALMAREFPELDLWHPWDIDVERAIALGVEIEDAGRAVPRISNSEGAAVQAGETLAVYANSHGFVGRERGTRHMLSCALIAEDDAGMQRDYWYDSVRAAADFMPAAELGRKAAERTVARLGARKLSTRQCPVLFVPEVARSLIGHLVHAVSGGALYRKASFLLDHAGRQVLPAFVDIVERPHLPRGHGSTAFDAEGVATRESPLVLGGVLQRYVLGSYSARKLGLTTTANAGGIHNLVVAPGGDDFAALLKRMGSGLVVTEVMGQGVSIVTGDYSRGAAGFWVENGAIAYPVEEITIAANLRDMFAGIVAVGSDVDPRSHILTGSILVERMTVAGE